MTVYKFLRLYLAAVQIHSETWFIPLPDVFFHHVQR
jgi:hypothetical protein